MSATEVPAELSESVVLLDVREDDEWALGHAPGAVHIPLAEIPGRFGEVDMDADLYVVCRQGGRSVHAVEFLNNVGFDAVNVRDGMVAWQKAGRPLTNEDGQAKIY
ncbi:rhodanese-like domain-containing protein [Antrihabitans cavernicola]|uniref:Rhodanese-like domain-containing protein n=1 Tax=Antrihabitans cavernicola TaxID=2495913 RepID=A0A5A7SLF4_9NOCA|nr:rhodanese-like domain-containing protein [Spelaeibacter cavernicola]